MTRDDLAALGKLADADLAKLTTVEQTALDAHVAQANAADAKVEALQKKQAAKLADLQAYLDACGGTDYALKVKRADEIARLQKARADAETALATLLAS